MYVVDRYFIFYLSVFVFLFLLFLFVAISAKLQYLQYCNELSVIDQVNNSYLLTNLLITSHRKPLCHPDLRQVKLI